MADSVFLLRSSFPSPSSLRSADVNKMPRERKQQHEVTHHLDSYLNDPTEHTIGRCGARLAPPVEWARRELFPSHGGRAAGDDAKAFVGYENIKPRSLEVAQDLFSEFRGGVDSHGFDLGCDC